MDNTKIPKKPIQSNEERIVGWLSGTHIETFNTKWYSSILQGHKDFRKHHIQVSNDVFRASQNDKTKKTDSDATLVTVISTTHKPKYFNAASHLCRTIFNQQDGNHVRQLPAEILLCFVPWTADTEDNTIVESRLDDIKDTLTEHLKTEETSCIVNISSFFDLYTKISLKDNVKVSLLHVLMTIRCRVDEDCPIFFQVNKKLNFLSRQIETNLVCCKDQYKEGVEVDTNLCALLVAKFGERAKKRFFKPYLIQEASLVRYNRETMTLVPANGSGHMARKRRKIYIASNAVVNAAKKKEQSMDNFEEFYPVGNKLDSDNNENFTYSSEEVPVFNIDKMFDLEPALKANPQYDDFFMLSFFTNTTTFNTFYNDETGSISSKESDTNHLINAKTSKMDIVDTTPDAEITSSEQQTRVSSENE